MGESATITRSRRLPFWAMIIALVICALAGVFVLLWFKLPTWAPAWVVEHSPWVDPILRAVEANDLLAGPARLEIEERGVAAVPLLLARVTSENEVIRELAVQCLGDAKDTRAVNVLLAAIGDQDDLVGEAAIVALGKIGDARAIPKLVEILLERKGNFSSEPGYSWKPIAEALEGCPHTQVLDVLLPLPPEKEDEDAVIMTVVSRLRDQRAIAALDDAMRNDSVISLTPEVYFDRGSRGIQAARGLAFASHPDGVPKLLAAFRDPAEAIRVTAVASVASLNRKEEVDARLLVAVSEALRDHASLVRQFAALACRSHQVVGAEERLLALMDESDPDVRLFALMGLGATWTTTGAIPKIASFLQDEDSRIRATAVRSLQATGRIATLDHLLTAWSEGDESLKRSIRHAVCSHPFVGDPRTFPLLLELLAEISESTHHTASGILVNYMKLDEQQRAQVDEVVRDRHQRLEKARRAKE